MVDTNVEYTKYMKKQYVESGRKSTCNVSSGVYYLDSTFKASEYILEIQSFCYFLADFLKF